MQELTSIYSVDGQNTTLATLGCSAHSAQLTQTNDHGSLQHQALHAATTAAAADSLAPGQTPLAPTAAAYNPGTNKLFAVGSLESTTAPAEESKSSGAPHAHTAILQVNAAAAQTAPQGTPPHSFMSLADREGHPYAQVSPLIANETALTADQSTVLETHPAPTYLRFDPKLSVGSPKISHNGK